MEVWVLSVSYGNLHGIYSSKERAYEAAINYAEEDVPDEVDLIEVKEGLKHSYEKDLDYFTSEGYMNYINAECWRVDEEFE